MTIDIIKDDEKRSKIRFVSFPSRQGRYIGRKTPPLRSLVPLGTKYFPFYITSLTGQGAAGKNFSLYQYVVPDGTR